jgi:transposase
MMGPAKTREGKLFYSGFSLEDRVRADNPLRAIQAKIDFSFVRVRVQDLYGRRGNPSIDPAVLMKLMFLLFLENVHSERALMARMSERLDWLWFCGFDLDDSIPNHSVISKARRRWGPKVFQEFFARILRQCIEAGLVDGQQVHVDSSLINANASKDHLHPELRLAAEQLYRDLENAETSASQTPDTAGPASPIAASPAAAPSLPAAAPAPCPAAVQAAAPTPSPVPEASRPLASRMSDTDPDARLETKNGKTVLGFKDHRVVDDRNGIVTGTHTTDASVRDPQIGRAHV